MARTKLNTKAATMAGRNRGNITLPLLLLPAGKLARKTRSHSLQSDKTEPVFRSAPAFGLVDAADGQPVGHILDYRHVGKQGI